MYIIYLTKSLSYYLSETLKIQLLKTQFSFILPPNLVSNFKYFISLLIAILSLLHKSSSQLICNLPLTPPITCLYFSFCQVFGDYRQANIFWTIRSIYFINTIEGCKEARSFFLICRQTRKILYQRICSSNGAQLPQIPTTREEEEQEAPIGKAILG